MKSLLAAGPRYLFRGLRAGQPGTAALGAALVMWRLIKRDRGGKERVAARRLQPGDEIAIRVER